MAFEKKPKTDKVMVDKDSFFTKKGKLYKLSKNNFNMKTKEGKILFQEYAKCCADVKIEQIKLELDPKAKLQAKIEKQKEMVTAMETELESMGG